MLCRYLLKCRLIAIMAGYANKCRIDLKKLQKNY